MSQHYSDPNRESDPWALPDIEVFELTAHEEGITAGWYYWYCFPGCMPDSDAIGPYATHAEALQAAQEEAAQ